MPVTLRLPRRLGILLPSLDRDGVPIDARTRLRVRSRVLSWFSRAFPGSTEDRVQIRPRLRGRWGSGATVTVEKIEEIWSYCTAAELARLKPSLVRLAESICQEADQDAVALLIDTGMEIVKKGGRNDATPA
jgi:hypothetical protein